MHLSGGGGGHADTLDGTVYQVSRSSFVCRRRQQTTGAQLLASFYSQHSMHTDFLSANVFEYRHSTWSAISDNGGCFYNVSIRKIDAEPSLSLLQSSKWKKRRTKRKSRTQWPIPAWSCSHFPIPIGRRGAETGSGELSRGYYSPWRNGIFDLRNGLVCIWMPSNRCTNAIILENYLAGVQNETGITSRLGLAWFNKSWYIDIFVLHASSNNAFMTRFLSLYRCGSGRNPIGNCRGLTLF